MNRHIRGHPSTGGPRLMRVSLLRFFKTFQTYLAYAVFGLFISLLQVFGYFWSKNRSNEMNSPKKQLGKSQ